MSTPYTLNMSLAVRTHFQNLMADVHQADEDIIVANVESSLKQHENITHADYVDERIGLLTQMLSMFLDEQWHLSSVDKKHILIAFHYFSEGDDVIPDEIPVIGLIDDCIVIDLVNEKVVDQLKKYQQFIKAVKAYDLCRSSNQVDLWHNITRQETFSRIRHRRRKKLSYRKN